MKTKKILTIMLVLVLLAVICYLFVFGRALSQEENHRGILFVLPRAILTSEAVPVDKKTYFAKDINSFLEAMEEQGFKHIDGLGSGHVFIKDGENYMSMSRMYSKYFMLFSYPVTNSTTTWTTHSTPPLTFKVPSDWNVILETYQIRAVAPDMGSDTIITSPHSQNMEDRIVLKLIQANCDPNQLGKCSYIDAYGGTQVWSFSTYSTNPEILDMYDRILATLEENGKEASIRKIK